MRIKDYCYLASLNSLRNKKRTTRIVTGFVLGISFLILTLFLLFSTHFTSMDVANKNKVLNSISFSFNSEDTEIKDFYEAQNGIENIQKYGTVNVGYKGIYTIIDGSYYYDRNGLNGMATDNLNTEFAYSIDSTFIVEGEASIKDKEIMLSEKYLIKHNINPNEIIGKKISIISKADLYLSTSYYIDNGEEKKITFETENIHLLDEYVVSGIYKNNGYSPYMLDFIINSNSYYNVTARETRIVNNEINYFYEHNIDYYLSVAKEEGKLLLFNSISSPTTINMERITYESFKMTLDAYYKSNKENKSLFSGSIENYINYKKIVDSLTLFFSLIGITIFLISILSLFSIINYNIERKHENIGILKALGAKNKEVFNMLLVELSIYFVVSFFISFIITSAISLVGIIIVNKEVFSKLSFGNLSLSISIVWYFLAAFIILVAICLILYIYALIAFKKVSKEKIMNLIK